LEQRELARQRLVRALHIAPLLLHNHYHLIGEAIGPVADHVVQPSALLGGELVDREK
jgi:hypothetical protein